MVDEDEARLKRIEDKLDLLLNVLDRFGPLLEKVGGGLIGKMVSRPQTPSLGGWTRAASARRR